MAGTSTIRRRARRGVGLGLLVLVTGAASGCFELETTIRVQEDGGATIVERFVLSEALLDLDAGGTAGPGLRVADLLSRKSVEARRAKMGEGLEILEHVVRDAPGGGRESRTVFRIADLGKFRYASPFLGVLGPDVPDSTVACSMFPVYEGTWWGRRAGEMGLDFKPVVKLPPPPDPKAPRPKGPAPADLQVLRDLQPVFRDLCRGVRIRVSVESYAPVRCRGRIRNGGAGTKIVDLIDFSDDDLDRFGDAFLENEEVMLALLRGDVAAPVVVSHVQEHASNSTVPVFHPQGCGEIWFAPSRPLFDRLFQGKMLTFYFEKGPDRTRPAKFDEVGYKPPPTRPNGAAAPQK